ncbi:hypothetical protein CCM_07590 [Cordyceps militaris CM01]|uniref:Necrosis inducing n=2 Tax=Cordyceps militaris TaxID=73501 RepID=G3JQ88_CORMM|nr:uncharacterized protein CCM_07590 [Cordyceps militaris CM01]ATY63275.1 Necrosis inducing [Cordyceps militaris]EGX89339.1 hypothetical protein CCM_07590 [Cordyceps militaris CM01]
MRVSFSSTMAAVAGLWSLANANTTPVSDKDMNDLLNEGGVSLAMKAAPMFFFGQALNHPPCIPTFATDKSNRQTPPADLCDWPDTGCNCRTPGVPIGNPSPSFPVYYSYQKCTDTSVRIQYSLFYQKDGFNPTKVFGHHYDWERVLVIWKKSDDGLWRPAEIKLSQHSGYQTLEWDQIQNTFSDDTAGEKLGGPNGQKNLNHAKVYVAWSKHDHHNDRNTGFNDALSQLTNNAFRSQDWWYLPQRGDYIRADGGTEIGRLMRGMDWGDASSNPALVHDSLCSA